MAGAGTTPQFSWPAVLTASNNVLEFDENGPNLTATLAAGSHFWRGAGAADAGAATDLAHVLKVALDAAGGQVYTVTLADSGLLTVTAAAVFALHWGSVVSTVTDALFGSNGASTALATSHTSNFQVGNAWHPEQIYIEDSEAVPSYASSVTPLMNGRTRTQRWGSRTKRRILVDVLPPRKVFQAEEVRSQESFQRFYDSLSQGVRFELCPDFPNTRGTYSTLVPDPDAPQWIEQWPATIPHATVRRYNIELLMQSYVS